jgi:alanine-alpha-ketoisovalerate/valine-pyruvate aminotransferase
MLGVAVTNFSTRNSKSKVLKNLLVYKNLMLCRAYGYGYKTISLAIMNGSNPKFFHIILTLCVKKDPSK